MSIFVGNISNRTSLEELEDLFLQYGPCKMELKNKYAFIDYEREIDAEKAQLSLDNYKLNGLRMTIQWSKKSGRFSRQYKEKNNNYKKDSTIYEKRTPDYNFQDQYSYEFTETEEEILIPEIEIEEGEIV